MCGNVDHYEVVQSNGTITPSNFASQEPASGAPAPTAPGTTQSMQIPPERRRFVAVRAVDEQGNVGPPAVTEIPNYVRPKGASPLHVSLVPAFRGMLVAQPHPRRAARPPVVCSAAAGLPAAHGRCARCERQAGAVDRIGAAARRARRSGDPCRDEADVKLSVSITDVRKRSDLSDYTGELQLSSLVRITDRYNGPSRE